ncbi:MAG: glycoside hydrolase family 5 protein, partial [Acidimicrobiales bacterium]
GPVTAGASTARGNLLVGDQADFSSSTGGWVGYQANLQWVGNVGVVGSGALEMQPGRSSSGTSYGISAWSGVPAGAPAPTSGSEPSPNVTTATPGLVYGGWAKVMPADGGNVTDEVSSAIAFWDNEGKAVGGYFPATPVNATSGVWTSTMTATAIAPPGSAYVSFGVDEYSSTGSWDLDIEDAVLNSMTGDAPPVVGPLHTSGMQIIDGTGHPVTLRGISYIGLAIGSDPSDLTEGTFAGLHQWGATMVRFALNEDLWDQQSCAYDPNYKAAVQEAVNWTTSLGMVALLTLIAGIPQDINATATCPTQGQQNMADSPGSDDFWSSVAATFKSNPLVAFDLFNEPHDISPQVWHDGGSQSGFQGQGMQGLYDDVRRAGASNLAFVEGYNWANTPPPPGELINGYNVVYDVHYYTCPGTPPPQCSYQGNPYDPSYGLDPWVTFQSQEHLPVFVGEFGWPSSADGTYVNNVIAFAESQGWGWAAYNFDSWTGDRWDLVSSVASNGLMQPSLSGMPVLEDMAAHTPPPGATASRPAPDSPGYWMAGADGGVFAFGAAPFLGSMGGTPLNAPVVAMAGLPGGYRLAASDGGVFAFGAAPFLGSMGGTPLNAPVVAMAGDPITGGYWLVGSDGGVFSFGAPFYGSTGSMRLNAPIVAVVPTPDGGGYWLVASDGGVFSFGDARYFGSMGGTPLAKPVVAVAATPDGGGYWLVASDGGVFSFGDAGYFGSMGGTPLNAPVTAVVASSNGAGYLLVGSDGGVFSFGDSPYEGSLGGMRLTGPVVATAVP